VASYAAEEDLAEYLIGGDYEDDTPEGEAAIRILKRATEVIERASRGTYDTDQDPLPVTITEALRDATCAQVEQWLEVGEEVDIGGWNRAQGVKYGAVSVESLPSALAPRAARILDAEGILNEVGRDDAGASAPADPIGVDII